MTGYLKLSDFSTRGIEQLNVEITSRISNYITENNISVENVNIEELIDNLTIKLDEATGKIYVDFSQLTSIDASIVDGLDTFVQDRIDVIEFPSIEHNQALINSEEGLHGIRIWNNKVQQWNVEDGIWIDVASGDISNLEQVLDELIKVKLEGLETAPLEHTHSISEVDDLETVLDSKADKSSVYTLSDDVTTLQTSIEASLTNINNDVASINNEISDLETDLTNITTKVNTNTTEISGIKTQLANGVASAVHKHPISDVNLLQDSLDTKANKSDLQSLTNNFNTHKHVISEVTDLQSELDGRALKTDFNVLKSNFDGHKHEIADVNLLTDRLANTAPLSHTHTWTQISGRPTATTAQIDSAVTNSHNHANINILENLEDGNGVLIYNGAPLGEVAYISVESIQDRDNIPMSVRKEGLMVLVIEDGGMYYLKGGVDNAFWQIFATGAGGATNASTLPANPIGGLTGTNTQALIEQLESRKANVNNVYSKAEMETFMQNYPIDYLTLDNLPNLSLLHGHDNLETLNLFNQYQGNLTWKGKTLGDLMTEIYDADKDGVIDVAAKLKDMTSTVAELNYLSGTTGNIQSQINAISSGVTFKGEYANYSDMTTSNSSPTKGDLVYIKTDENKGNATDTQYCYDGTAWIYGGGTTKTPDATSTTKGVIQLGGDLAHPSSTSTAPKLTTTGVTEGLYKSANITVGEDGRITYAEEGSVVFLNDAIVSDAEGWSSNKINEELTKLSPRNHTHVQLHNANMLGAIELAENGIPSANSVPTYNPTTGKAEWTEQEGGRVYIGSKSIKGDYTLEAGSYITLLIDEETKKITINSTYRENGGNVVPTGFQITETVTVDANSKVRFSVQSPFNKSMLHTVQMSNDKNVVGEIRIYNQSTNGYVEYNSNPEMTTSDIVAVPIFDDDNSKMMHLEVENYGIETAKFKIRLKCTNLL